MKTTDVLNKLNLSSTEAGTWIGNENITVNRDEITSFSPIDGEIIGKIKTTDIPTTIKVIEQSNNAFNNWKLVPGPKRGELVRIYSNLLREHKNNLANLITLEVGKIQSEAQGEVQEMIDICDYALGLSRQLTGLTMTSERSKHRLMEQWHPLGIVGVISAFNFPMAVWAWNAMIAMVCGNSVIWKPSEKALYSAIACHKLFQEACKIFKAQTRIDPGNISCLISGKKDLGIVLSENKNIPVVSATGSTIMGKDVAIKVASRLGRYLLELGGNNAMIISESANLDLAVRAITFAAVGTAGQRCTTLRRLIVHKSIKKDLVKKLTKTYQTIKIGSPWEKENLVGPLIDEIAKSKYELAIHEAKKQGGIVYNEGNLDLKIGTGAYVRPVLIEISECAEIIKQETFAPILYIIEYETFSDAIRINNNVPQGLSSAVFTSSLKEAELFLSPIGSDCGIANVNIGTSGAEIGGAFGGEKETGGGRECGSDAWKAYMRRTTNTINYSDDLPLAQGVVFL